MTVDWNQQRREYGSLIHLDIQNDKIWIQSDGTEVGIANELVEAGVPQADIVLGFKSSFKRQFTDYAVK
ncbi:XisI protein [Oscillatoria sp. FACHB-1406]|nr:XisI protein [Oscillatoria sp. FACHB-1406]